MSRLFSVSEQNEIVRIFYSPNLIGQNRTYTEIANIFNANHPDHAIANRKNVALLIKRFEV